VLDADYGVFMPHDIQYLERNSEKVESYYRDIMSRIPNDIRLPMMKIYQTSKNNSVVNISEKVGTKGFFIINISAYAIWLVPFILMVPPLFLRYQQGCYRK